MGISVIVPVGPQEEYKDYLGECLQSIHIQAQSGDEIVVVDDMAKLSIENFIEDEAYCPIVHHRNLWLLGCASSWNIGVALASNEWCILMGSDDMLIPGCLDACREIINSKPDQMGLYNLTCELQSGELMDLYNNAAMVSKSLWNLTGGFPISGGAGAADSLLISIMLKHIPEHLHQIKQGTPLYWVRQHAAQETSRQAGLFATEVVSIRGKETARWKPPIWT